MPDVFDYGELRASVKGSEFEIVDAGLARIANEGERPELSYDYREGDEAFQAAVRVLFIMDLIRRSDSTSLCMRARADVRNSYSLDCAHGTDPRRLIVDMHSLAAALHQQQSITVQCPTELLNGEGTARETVEIPADFRLVASAGGVRVVVRHDSSLTGLLSMLSEALEGRLGKVVGPYTHDD